MASKMNNKRLDKTFHDKVNHVQKHNGINVFWDKEGVWKKIQKALAEGSNGPKMIAWYTAMAASVSLLVASSVTIKDYFLPFSDDNVEIEAKETLNMEVKNKQTAIQTSFISLPADSMIIPLKSRKVNMISSEDNPVEVSRIAKSITKLDYGSGLQNQGALKLNHARLVSMHLGGGVSVNKQFISPKIDVGVSLNLSRRPEIRNRIILGTSVQFIQNIEVGDAAVDRFTPGYFVRSAYENEKFKNGKLRGWSTGAEYLIHSEDDSLPDHMLKVFYTRTLMNKLKVGPEILFTNNFRRIYPGITLAFG